MSPAPRTPPAIAASATSIVSERWPEKWSSGIAPIAIPAMTSETTATRQAPSRSANGPPIAIIAT
jgi:hypothetical protein